MALLLTALGLGTAAHGIAPLHPESRYGHCSVLVGDQLWVIGGHRRLSNTLDSRVLVFDPASRQYTHAIDVGLPGLEGHSCSVTPGGFSSGFLVYIVGGWSNETGTLSTTRKGWVIHAPTDSHPVTAKALPELPAPLRRHSAVVTQLTKAIYVWGGSHGGPANCTSTNQLLRLMLNPPSSAWEILSPFGTPPSPRYGHTATLNSFVWQHFEGYMVLVGGNSCKCGPQCTERFGAGADFLSDVHVLDLDKLSWLGSNPKTGPGGRSNGLDARYGHSAVLIGDARAAQLCVLAGTALNSSCALERHGKNVSGCVYHSAEILCTHPGWQTGTVSWSAVPTNHTGPVSRDRHTTTLISRPSAPCVDCGHGEPIPVTRDYRWLDTGGFHSGSRISTERVYGSGVHELHHAPGGAADKWTWSAVWS